MNTDILVADNNQDLDILQRCVEGIKNVSGFTLEIGVRAGGTSKLIIDTLKKENIEKVHIGIDPFGELPFQVGTSVHTENDFTNNMKNKMLKEMYDYIYTLNAEFIFFALEDTEFFNRYADGVPIYYNHKKEILNEYALVFVDGQHTPEAVTRAFDFFKGRIARGGFIVFDDTDKYQHFPEVDEYIRSFDYRLHIVGKVKVAYQRY